MSEHRDVLEVTEAVVRKVARAIYCAQDDISEDHNMAHVDYWFDPPAGSGDDSVAEEYERMARAALAAASG